MVLSQKGKRFPLVLIVFSESTQNFAHFEHKDQLQRLNISEVIEPEKCG